MSEHLDVETATFREETQKTILEFLSTSGFFRDGVFQGGTALRLIYENPRFSEDLDFVFTSAKAPEFQDSLTTLESLPVYLLRTLPAGAEVTLTSQRDDKILKRAAIKIRKVIKSTLQINLEFGAYPAYEHRAVIAPFPPLYPVIRVESLDEILADKVVALGLRSYLKGRDLWDLHFLIELKKLTFKAALVVAKIQDYGSDLKAFNQLLSATLARLPAEGPAQLDQEMQRFLSPDRYEAYRPLWAEIIKEIHRPLEAFVTSGQLDPQSKR